MNVVPILLCAVPFVITGGLADATASDPDAAGTQYRYVWTSTNRRQFTPAEYASLTGFGLVILQPAHGSSFEDEWILRDSSGEKLQNVRQGEERGWQVDVANPDYRQFIENQIAERMRSAPYDGVILDSFHPYVAGGLRGLSAEAVGRLNAGLAALLREVKKTVGSGRLVLYNGLARGQAPESVRDNRGFGYLALADGAQDEFFCFLDSKNVFRDSQQTAADAQVYRHYATTGKTIIYSVKLRNSAARAAQAHVKRFCFGNFLMGYVPGRSLIQFKEYGSQDKGPQIQNSGAPEERIPLGRPLAAPVRNGTIVERRFASGLVVVNLGSAPARFSSKVALTVWNGGVRGRNLRKGLSYVVPARDAAFFLTR